MQNHRLAFGLLLAVTVLATGCRGLRCNLLSGRDRCLYGCTDCPDSACGGCCEECCEDCHSESGTTQPVLSPPPLPATGGADVNVPPDVSAKVLPQPRQVKPTDVAPPSLRVAERLRAERTETKPPPQILPESAPTEPIRREPTPATGPTATGPTAKPVSKPIATRQASAERPATARFVNIVRPTARYETVTPGTGAMAQDRASRGAVFTAWYIGRAEPLIVKGSSLYKSPARNRSDHKGPVHKSLAPSKPAKTVHSTLRFRTASVVTLKSTGQSSPLGPVQASGTIQSSNTVQPFGSVRSSDAVQSSTLASPPPRLQSVRIRSARR